MWNIACRGLWPKVSQYVISTILRLHMIINRPVQGPNLVITVPADALEAKRSIGTKTLRNTNQHDDVIKWKHFPRYWPFVRGIRRSTVNSPHKGQWRGALMFTLICDRINGWVNNCEAGDLRRNRAHYDVIVMRANYTLFLVYVVTYNIREEVSVKIQIFSFANMRLKMHDRLDPSTLPNRHQTISNHHADSSMIKEHDCGTCLKLLITMTSEWARWLLKSPASRLLTQPFIRAQIKVNIKAPRHWPLCGEFTGDRWIPRANGQ